MFSIVDPALGDRFSNRDTVPIFVNCFNRVSVLRSLVDWLLRMGQRRIVLIDNASTYPPLLDYYREIEVEASVTVVQLGLNLGHIALWASGLLRRVGWAAKPFVYTDPDILPDPDCPSDWLRHFTGILEQHPAVVKVGFGLRIDDLPSCYRFRAEVQDWERQFWLSPVADGQFRAPIDTTFALYRGGIAWSPQAVESARFQGIRTGPPYVARHLDWYVDSAHPTEEQVYYRARILPGVSSWSGTELPMALQEGIALVRRGARMGG